MERITARVQGFGRLNPNAFAYVLYVDVNGVGKELYATSATACKDVVEVSRVYDFEVDEYNGRAVALKVSLNRRLNTFAPPLDPGMGLPDPKNLELIMDDIDRQIFIIEAEERFKRNVLLVGDTIKGRIGRVEEQGSEFSFDLEAGEHVEKCHVIPGIASTIAVKTLAQNQGRTIKLYGVHTPNGFFVHKICK